MDPYMDFPHRHIKVDRFDKANRQTEAHVAIDPFCEADGMCLDVSDIDSADQKTIVTQYYPTRDWRFSSVKTGNALKPGR